MNNLDIINKINNFYNNKSYQKCIKLYKIISLNDNYKNNCDIYINMSICYLKLKQYADAKEYILLYINNSNINEHQSWGILGASLYGLKKIKESLNAYNKAYELKKKKIYNIMINKINIQLCVDDRNTLNNIFNKNPQINNLFNSLITDNKMLDKINDVEFQNKLMELQTNPLNALKDPEIMNIMNSIINKL